MTPLVKDTVRWMAEGGLDPTQYHFFDLSGAFDNRTPVEVQPLMTHRPPFEKSMVVWKGATKNHPHYETMMQVVGTDPEEGIVVSMWKGPSGRMPTAIPPMVYIIDGDTIRYGPVNDTDSIDREVAELILAVVGGWYSAMDRRIDAHVATVRQSYTNRRKLAQGKAPAYDWRTVVIQPTAPRQADRQTQGTHASPRLHDRRGHLRRLRTGKNVWVKPCKVGDPSRGAVFHDYKVQSGSPA